MQSDVIESNSRSFPSTAAAVAFPLGGIGTGNVSIGARGEFRDWEIFNCPAKGQSLPNTFWALRTQTMSGEATTRVLEAAINPPHTRGLGYHPSTAAGLPHVARATFRGEYPFAWVDFEDAALPVSVQLEAYTPLIPLDAADSGLPCAVFTFEVKNVSNLDVNITLVGSLVNAVGGISHDLYGNPISAGQGGNINRFVDQGSMRGLFFSSMGLERTELGYGDISLVTDHRDITMKPAWLRGIWYDDLREFWEDLSTDGKLNDLGYEQPSAPGKTDTGSLGVLTRLPPGQVKRFRFVLAWYFPNRRASWTNRINAPIMRNFYATRFSSSWGVARYMFEHRDHLETTTRRFHRALFGSTLPSYVVEAVAANIVPLRSNTCFWLENGGFYGYEGCLDDSGCCGGTCTHVWSYAYTLAFLFPSLERRMRWTEFVVEAAEDGYVPFRSSAEFGHETAAPGSVDTFMDNVGRPLAAADGHFGSLLRAYREWLVSGDRDWLQEVWPGIKRAIGYAETEWDKDRDGVLEGRQHTTYDVQFYGPNPLCATYYLAALRAVERLATEMNDTELASRCNEIAERGSQNADKLMWNGAYYSQSIDDVNAYPYQFGSGCLSDQLLGQLHAHILGLGYLLPPSHVKSALGSVFKHNFRRSLRNHINSQRTYALNDESGLLLCSWPDGGAPRYPFVYSDEVWTGIEYQVAAHLIYEGLIDEALTVVRAARERHDGIRRNPWDEVECGHHYARGMASWAILLAASGFHCDMKRHELRFDPVLNAANNKEVFSVFWSSDRGWGTYTQSRDHSTGDWIPRIEVLGGDMRGVKVRACGQVLEL